MDPEPWSMWIQSRDPAPFWPGSAILNSAQLINERVCGISWQLNSTQFVVPERYRVLHKIPWSDNNSLPWTPYFQGTTCNPEMPKCSNSTKIGFSSTLCVQIKLGEFLCHVTGTYLVRLQNLNNAIHGNILLVGPDTDNLRWSSASSRQDSASSPIPLGLAETRIRFTCQLNTAKKMQVKPKRWYICSSVSFRKLMFEDQTFTPES
jgi:hypothetical protein